MPSEAELERLVVRVNGDASGYKKTMEQVKKSTDNVEGTVQLATRRISAFGLTLRGWGAGAAALVLPVVGAVNAVQSAFKGIGLAAEFEKNEAAFGTMLQSAEKGKKLMADIAALAAETPMNQADLQSGAKMLLQFGESAGKVVSTLRMLGDVSGGDSAKLQRLALAYGQVRGVGHVQGDELNQMLEAGFNPLRQMAQTKAGKGAGEDEIQTQLSALTKLKEQGGITFQMLEDSFKAATSEGGQFFNGMKNQANTLSGLFSTMQDDVDAFLRGVGQSLIENLDLKGFTKEVSGAAQKMLEWFKALDPVVMKTAVAVVAATVAFGGLAAAIALAGTIFNIAFGGIGYITGAIITALGAIIGLTTGWILSVGGISEAWGRVKAAAEAAWDWLHPIREALYSLGKSIKDNLFAIWDQIKEAAVAAWGKIVGDATVNWDRVREVARDAILWIEFGLNNIRDVADVAWKGVKYGAVVMFNELIHFWTEVVPAAVRWFSDNAVDIFTSLFNWVQVATSIVADNIQAAFLGIDWTTVWNAMKTTMKSVLGGGDSGVASVKKEIKEIPKTVEEAQKGIKPFVIPTRKIGELESQLKKELDEAKGKLGAKFDEFKAMKLAQFQRDSELALVAFSGQLAMIGVAVAIGGVAAEAKRANDQVKGLKNTLASFSGQSLVGSAADKRNIQEALYGSIFDRGLRLPPGAGPDPNRLGPPAVAVAVIPPGGRWQDVVNRDPVLHPQNPVEGPERVVQKLDEMLGLMRKPGGVQLVPANIGGVQ